MWHFGFIGRELSGDFTSLEKPLGRASVRAKPVISTSFAFQAAGKIIGLGNRAYSFQDMAADMGKIGYPPEIIGYAEPWIVAPGDLVAIKVR